MSETRDFSSHEGPKRPKGRQKRPTTPAQEHLEYLNSEEGRKEFSEAFPPGQTDSEIKKAGEWEAWQAEADRALGLEHIRQRVEVDQRSYKSAIECVKTLLDEKKISEDSSLSDVVGQFTLESYALTEGKNTSSGNRKVKFYEGLRILDELKEDFPESATVKEIMPRLLEELKNLSESLEQPPQSENLNIPSPEDRPK